MEKVTVLKFPPTAREVDKMIDVLGAVELPFQEAVSGRKPVYKSDVWPRVCGWPRSLQARDSTLCLAGSTYLPLRSKRLIWRQIMWLVRQVALENSRVPYEVQCYFPQDDIRGCD